MTNNNNTQLEEEPQGDEEIWLGAIRQKVGKHLFRNIQFITCEEDEKFGSVWQKLLCRQLPGCPIEKQELFWKTKGMTEARKALNRKRQNTNNAMKREFIGKLNIIWSGEKQCWLWNMCGKQLGPETFPICSSSMSFHFFPLLLWPIITCFLLYFFVRAIQERNRAAGP